MAQRVVLHVGAMKSGTTFLQHVLRENREVLRGHGVLFPGRTIGDQVRAVQDLIDPRRPVGASLDRESPWLGLVEEVTAWPDTAVISMEYLGPRRRPRIDAALASFPDSTVDVVLTARDLGRAVPSMWTESVQNRGTLGWAAYLAAVRSGPGQDSDDAQQATAVARRAFWRQQDVASIARRWSEAVGREHFTLITVPPPGADRGVLWSRFAEVLGVPAQVCDLGVTANRSIDAASALVLRALNERLAQAGISRPDYEQIVKRRIAKEGLAGRPRRGASVGFSGRWLRRRSATEIAALAALDLRVLGDLDELRARPVEGADPRRVNAAEQLDAALDALAWLVMAWAEERAGAEDG